MVFFTFAALLCLRACLCCGVYGAFRVLGSRFPTVLRRLSYITLALWVGGFAFFALGEEFAEGMKGPEPPYPLAFVADVGIMLLVTLATGGGLLRLATQKQWSWWPGILFCTLYLGAVYVIENWGLSLWGFQNALSHSWMQLVLRVHFWPLSTNFVALQELLNWFFPLGAPIAEIVGRSFRRAFVAHRDQSFA